MPRISFKTEWEDADGVRGAELAATFGLLEIRVDDSIVTRIADLREHTKHDFVYVSVYPLAEWMATNWWFLTHEVSSPAKEDDPDFRHRHSLSAAREGYAYPELQMVPQGGWTPLAWEPDGPAWNDIKFVEGGRAWIDSGEFRAACADLIERVISRLRSRGVEGTLLQEEWSAIREADPDEVEYCSTAARLGWDPYGIDDDERSIVMQLGGKLGGAALEEASAAFSARNPMGECAAVTGAFDRAKANGLLWERIGSIDRATLVADTAQAPTPWEAGYRLAQELRRSLDVDGTPLPSMDRIAEAIGEAPSLLAAVTSPVDLGAAALVDGVITRDKDRNPAFAFRQFSFETNRRFHFCRALGEALVAPGTATLLTRAYSERQQRNRAFAAEFLAPSAGLRQRITRRIVDGDEIDELAATFGVSSRVVEHQVRNHDVAEVWELRPSAAR